MAYFSMPFFLNSWFFHANIHSAAVAGGTNSYEKLFFTLTAHACRAQPVMKIKAGECQFSGSMNSLCASLGRELSLLRK